MNEISGIWVSAVGESRLGVGGLYMYYGWCLGYPALKSDGAIYLTLHTYTHRDRRECRCGIYTNICVFVRNIYIQYIYKHVFVSMIY
jgi:hypothetical protein